MEGWMNWTQTATELFRAPRPEHFTDFLHCCECEEHDQALLSSDIASIGLDVLGNPGWDPMCLAHC
jgi:hypothetical protein